MKKINIYNFLYYLSYFLLIVEITCTRVHLITPYLSFIQKIIIIILLFLIIIQSKSYNKKTLLLILILISLMIITSITTKSKLLFLTFVFIIAGKRIDLDDFIKKDTIFKIILLFIVIILYKIGLADSVINYRDDGTIRNSLGFPHPNYLGLFIFNICSGVIYINKGKYTKKDYLLLLISFIICLIICDSRASQFGILSLCVLMIFKKYLEEAKILKIVFQSLPIVFFALSYILTVMYNKGFYFIYELNKLISNRIMYAAKFLNYYGINLFGHEFEFYGNISYGNRLHVLDNAYMHLLIHYGLLVFIVEIIFLILILRKADKEKNYNIYIYLVPFLIYGLMERHIFELQFNGILLYFSSVIYYKKALKTGGNNNEKV